MGIWSPRPEPPPPADGRELPLFWLAGPHGGRLLPLALARAAEAAAGGGTAARPAPPVRPARAAPRAQPG